MPTKSLIGRRSRTRFLAELVSSSTHLRICKLHYVYARMQ